MLTGWNLNSQLIFLTEALVLRKEVFLEQVYLMSLGGQGCCPALYYSAVGSHIGHNPRCQLGLACPWDVAVWL
jgi:hypothetical protein